MYCSDDARQPGSYRFLAEFESSCEAYRFAGYLHSQFEYRDLSIVLEDVVRETEMASKDMVRLIFTPEGSVEEADGIFWRKEERKSWYKKW